MSIEGTTQRPASAHVVVLGNEKGGSGKSTIAMHVAVALLAVGQRVATVDLDSRQKSFTHYIEHRRAWARRAGIDLKVPVHFCVARGSTLKLERLVGEGWASSRPGSAFAAPTASPSA
jgi:chromosome partitioning protein